MWRQSLSSLQACIRIPGQTVQASDPCFEPALQRSPLPFLRKNENSESPFADNDGIDGDVRFMCPKARQDTRIGRRFRWLTQHVGVDQLLHSASVDSESMGTKKSFRGQARSQSPAPSFGGGPCRKRR